MRAAFKLSRVQSRAATLLLLSLVLIAGLMSLIRPARTSATPPAITNIETFLEQCPTNDPVYSQLRSDFEIRREGVVVGAIACSEPISGMAQAQYTDELITVQALRAIYYMEGGRSVAYPWTSGSLYDWLKSKIGGIDLRANGSYCCEQFGGKWYVVLNTQAGPDRDLARQWRGISERITLLAHETRHVDGFPHVGGCPLFPDVSYGCDQTYDEANLAPYAIQWWLHSKWLTGELNVGFSCLSAFALNQIANWHLDLANNAYRLRYVDGSPPYLSMPAQPGGACAGESQSATPTATPTHSPTQTATATPTPAQSPTPTASPTATASPTRTPSPTPTPSPTATPEPTATPTPRPSPSPPPTETPSSTPTPAFTAESSATPLASMTSAVSPPPAPTATPTPTTNAQPSASPSNTVGPTASPSPTAVKGDVDCDGIAGATDVLALLRDIGGLRGEAPADCTPDLDANCDGHVDARDALAVLLEIVTLGGNSGSCLEG